MDPCQTSNLGHVKCNSRGCQVSKCQDRTHGKISSFDVVGRWVSVWSVGNCLNLLTVLGSHVISCRKVKFSMVSSDTLRQLQDLQANLKLSRRLQTWLGESGLRAPRHDLPQIQQLITEILCPTNTADTAVCFKSYVLKLMQEDVFLLQVDCESAGELHDSILTAIASAPQESFQGIFVVYNSSQMARDEASTSLDLLLDNAAAILKVQYTTQNLNAPEGDQLPNCKQNSLWHILLSCQIQSDAMTSRLLPHMPALQAMFSHDIPNIPHPDIISAAVAYLVRDKHAKSAPSSKLVTRVIYTPDCDTMTCTLLRKYLHDGKFIPGVTGVSAAVAARISECIAVTVTAEGESFDCAGLRGIAGGMPASSMWAQTLLDILHTVDIHRPVISGVNTPTLILSQFLSSTLQHHEDLSAGALNILVAGLPKLWVSLADAAEYDQLLERGVGTSGSRDKKVMRSFHSMLDGDGHQHISMFLQYSGLTVYTVVGHKWHQTLSLGTSLAESMNHWIGLEPSTPHLPSALSSIASDLVALSSFENCKEGWPESYRSMAAAYFPDWKLYNSRAELIKYIETVISGSL